jgi:hypothetical protein
LCELYENAMKMFADDYTTGTDYKPQVATDELPF